MNNKFKIGDRFYYIGKGLLDTMPQIKVGSVTRIIETEKGFEYNDGLLPRYMYTSLQEVKKEATRRIEREYSGALSAVNTYADKLY